jgi:hypothetical protein
MMERPPKIGNLAKKYEKSLSGTKASPRHSPCISSENQTLNFSETGSVKLSVDTGYCKARADPLKSAGSGTPHPIFLPVEKCL